MKKIVIEIKEEEESDRKKPKTKKKRKSPIENVTDYINKGPRWL